MSPLESGLTTFPQAIGVAMMAQLAGRLYPRIGPRRMMMAGMTGVALTSLAFLMVDLQTSQGWIQLIMLARGWSFALALVPLQAATFATIRSADTGRASAVFNANRQVAASLGVALLGTVLTTRLTHYGSALGSTRHKPRRPAGLPRRLHRRCRPRRAGRLPLTAPGRQGGGAGRARAGRGGR